MNGLLVTELSVEGNGVAGAADTAVDTGLVQEVGEGQDGRGLDLILVAFNGTGVGEFKDFLQEGRGWGTDVHGEGHDDLSSLLSGQLLLLDQVNQELDVGVGTSNGDGIQEDVTGSLVLFGLTLVSQFVVKFLNILVVQESEDLGNGGDLGKSLGLSHGFLVGRDVFNDFLHEVLDSLLHARGLEG